MLKNIISHTYTLHSTLGFYLSKFNLKTLRFLWIICWMCHRFWLSVWFILWNVPLNVGTYLEPQYLTFKLPSWLLPVKLLLQKLSHTQVLMALDPAEFQKCHLIVSGISLRKSLVNTDSHRSYLLFIYNGPFSEGTKCLCSTLLENWKKNLERNIQLNTCD